ncbi:hypothetical protein F5887DRAFT_1134780, partial [Amanita rubescens]
KNAVATLTEWASPYDTDGIDVHFLNHEAVGRNIKVRITPHVRVIRSRSHKCALSSPHSQRPTLIGNKLEELLQEYLSIIEPLHTKPALLKKIKPINFLIITDRYPTDDPEAVIVTPSGQETG